MLFGQDSGGHLWTQPAVLGRVSIQYVHGAPFDVVFFLAPFWTSVLYFALIKALPQYEALIASSP